MHDATLTILPTRRVRGEWEQGREEREERRRKREPRKLLQDLEGDKSLRRVIDAGEIQHDSLRERPVTENCLCNTLQSTQHSMQHSFITQSHTYGVMGRPGQRSVAV